MKEGRKPEYPESTPGYALQKMPPSTTRRFKPQARLEPAHSHWWQARKADVLTVTPHVHTKNINIGSQVATLSDSLRYGVSARTGLPGVYRS